MPIRSFSFFVFLLFIVIQTGSSQDSLELSHSFTESEILPAQTGILLHHQGVFKSDSLNKYHFSSVALALDTGFISGKKYYFRFVVKNTSAEIIDISIAKNVGDSMHVFIYNPDTVLIKTDQLNIRGLSLFGRISLSPGSSKEIYAEVTPLDRTSLVTLRDLQFRVLNYNTFLEEELPGRFIDSLLIGLLLFSALLNLILGIILKRKSFIYLFFYLLSLVLFSFSFLGFYDEFITRRSLHIPIGLPAYFLTLILFLQVSKQYLQLEKHLPGWNTITNVIMFFLTLSIPYYYLTVYIESFFNSFLAFSSLFFFVIAAFMGLFESIILFRKVPKSKYFLIANLIVIISLVINLFLDNKYLVVIGSVVQGFIFTIGLAEEIKLLDRQKLRFQQRYINQLEVNLRLKDKLTADLERKVNERTRELKHANDELREKNFIVEQQKELLEIRSKEIKDSIEYARRIQNASFPSRKIIEKITSDYFILYKPRDIVSGDFYWFGEVEDKIIIIAADCTGHGVPGAFMSMYGIAFLNEIVNKEKVFRPSDILNSLRDKIAGSLNRGDNEFETMDGMDMSVVTIDVSRRSLMFAGANNPLYHIRNGNLDLIRADKMPVAFFQKMDPFNIIEFEYMPGDVIYIFTDGIIDQFGGELGKKFLSKRLKDVLLDISSLSMTEQYIHLNNSFNDWKGEYFQVDDVLMVGFRL